VSNCMSVLTTSVIMPVLNGAPFITEAVNSVLSQLTNSDELLVIDDGSTDHTRQLLSSSDRRLRVFDSNRRGPSAARNVGLINSRGDLIAFLDHDDLWPAGRHAALAAALTQNHGANAAVGRVRIQVEPGAPADGYLNLDGRFAPSLLLTCLYRRSLITQVGLFDESLRYGEDLEYYLRLADAGLALVHCDHDGLIYRRHWHNATNTAPPSHGVLLQLLYRRLQRARAQSTGTGKDGVRFGTR
jgi:glycosyltransferase involved in cell wall biosynthesis